jgi:hypothetical protein
MFQRNILPPSSGSKNKPSKKPVWKQVASSAWWYVPPKHRLTFKRLHGITSQWQYSSNVYCSKSIRVHSSTTDAPYILRWMNPRAGLYNLNATPCNNDPPPPTTQLKTDQLSQNFITINNMQFPYTMTETLTILKTILFTLLRNMTRRLPINVHNTNRGTV